MSSATMAAGEGESIKCSPLQTEDDGRRMRTATTTTRAVNCLLQGSSVSSWPSMLPPGQTLQSSLYLSFGRNNQGQLEIDPFLLP